LGDVHVEGSSVLCRLISHGVRAYVSASYAGGGCPMQALIPDGRSTWPPARPGRCYTCLYSWQNICGPPTRRGWLLLT
jgi:hypothetical protein